MSGANAVPLERHRTGDILPPGRRFGAEVLPVGTSTGPHTHDFCEFAVVVAGTAEHGTRHGVTPVRRGHAVGVRPCDWHQWLQPVGLRVANVYVDQSVLRSQISTVAADPVLRMFAWPVPAVAAPGIALLGGSDLRRVEHSIDALASISHRAGASAAADIAATGYLLAILGALAAILPAHSPAHASTACVDAVRTLEDDLTRGWTVRSLAGAVGLSAGHLTRQFRIAFGAAPMQVLTGLRANRAAAALIASDSTVASIGRQIGWDDPNYFSRRFRSAYQMSPTEYRRRFR